MRTTAEFMAEARRRAAVILEKRTKRRRKVAAIGSSALAAALIVTAGVMLPTGPGQAAAAALGGETAPLDVVIGGYALVGVIAFAVSVTAVLLFQRWRKRKVASLRTNSEIQGDLR